MRKTGGMRFRGRVEFWVDVTSLDQAEHVVQAAEQTAHVAIVQTVASPGSAGIPAMRSVETA